MWGAIKTDLIDFISTIKDDTTKGINQVLGEIDSDCEVSDEVKMITDVNRSFNTFSSEIEEKQHSSYGRFLKKFTLSKYSNEIAELLDKEIDVPRFYAELVPAVIKPEQFWSRYFFRVSVVRQQFNSAGHALNQSIEDDEEELTWESEASPPHPSERTDTLPKGNATAVATETQNRDNETRVNELESENEKLKIKIKTLASRVTELELTLANKNNTISTMTQENQSLKAQLSSLKEESSAGNKGLVITSTNDFASIKQTVSVASSAESALTSSDAALLNDSEDVSENSGRSTEDNSSMGHIGGAIVHVSTPSIVSTISCNKLLSPGKPASTAVSSALSALAVEEEEENWD